MAGINKAILVGNVGRDPEMRYTASGDTIANLSIATSESWKDKHTGEKKEKTEWHRIVAWRQLGDIIGKYVIKGTKLYVEGKITTRKWQDRDGHDRYTTEIVANTIQIMAGGAQRPEKNRGQSSPPPQQQTTNYGGDDDFDDDIPF